MLAGSFFLLLSFGFCLGGRLAHMVDENLKSCEDDKGSLRCFD